MSSVARRSLLTATASGALLGALWFVPTAHSAPADRPPATVELSRTQHAAATTRLRAAADGKPVARAGGADSASASAPGSGRLADTGGVDTAPYLIGGIASLGIGAGFVLRSAHRNRAAA